VPRDAGCDETAPLLGGLWFARIRSLPAFEPPQIRFAVDIDDMIHGREFFRRELAGIAIRGRRIARGRRAFRGRGHG